MLVFPVNGEAKKYETIGTTTTAIGCTSSNLVSATVEGLKGIPCKAILVTVETASVNVTWDGTTPTVTAGTNVGHTITAGQSLILTGWENVRNFQCINSAASSGAVVKVTYYF